MSDSNINIVVTPQSAHSRAEHERRIRQKKEHEARERAAEAIRKEQIADRMAANNTRQTSQVQLATHLIPQTEVVPQVQFRIPPLPKGKEEYVRHLFQSFHDMNDHLERKKKADTFGNELGMTSAREVIELLHSPEAKARWGRD